jgi:hypothetical protein
MNDPLSILRYTLEVFFQKITREILYKTLWKALFQRVTIWNYIRSILQCYEMIYFRTRIFIKVIISFLLAKQICNPTLKQVSCVFMCTLSNRTRKRIFGHDWEVPVVHLFWKRVEIIDSSHVKHIMRCRKNRFAAFCLGRNERENIFLQLHNKSEHVRIFL